MSDAGAMTAGNGDDTAPSWTSRIPTTGWRALAVIAIVHLVAALLVFDPTPQDGGDNAAYRALAQALATGFGYVRLWEPGHPPEALYPPAFPALLAAAFRAGIQSFAALQLLMIAASVAGVTAMAYWLRRVLPAVPAFVCGIIIALSPGLLDLSHAVLSDIPFAAFSMLALGAFASVGTETAHDTSRDRMCLAVGLAATVLAYFTRSAGLPLLLAVLVWLVWRRRYVASVVLVGIMTPCALAWSARARHAGVANYTDYLRLVDPYQPDLGTIDGLGWLSRIGQNGQHYAGNHLPTLLFGTGKDIAGLVGWIVFVLAVAGFVMRVRRREISLPELWIPMYAGLLLLWPETWSGERLLLPIYPVMLAYAFVPLPRIHERLPKHYLVIAFALCAVSLIVSDAKRTVRGIGCTAAFVQGNEFPCVEHGWDDFFLLSRSIRGRLPAGSVVISRKPTIFFAEAGYQSMVFPLSSAPDTLLHDAQRFGARYVMVDASPLTQRYVHDVVRTHPERFCSLPAFERNIAVLLRIEPPPAGAVPPPREGTPVPNCAPGGEK
jgi:hypothetical protein